MLPCFITEWEYDSTHEKLGKTYHLWKCKHREGYTAYTLTHQPAERHKDYVVPMGSGHWVGAHGLKYCTGINVIDN